MEEKKMLKLIDKDGNIVEYEILHAFWLEKTKKNYVIYTDNTCDKDGNLNIFASIYYPDDDSKLEAIETEEEWNAVEYILKSFREEKFYG